MKLSDENLFQFFGLHEELPKGASQRQISQRERNSIQFSYAITPYESREEYLRDKGLLKEYHNASAPKDVFLLVHAAKVERTEPELMR